MQLDNIFFLDKDTKNLPIAKKAILILSPAFYWFHKEKLDISLSQAKKIVPSIFEGIIPSGEYSYWVQKVEDEYWFFAYSDQAVLNKLSSLNIKPSQIAKIYPAQLLFYNLKNPVQIEDKVIVQEEGSVIVLPRNIFQNDTTPLDAVSLELPKRSLPLKAYGSSWLSEEFIYKAVIVLFIFILAYTVQVFVFKKDLAKLYSLENQIIATYHLPQTSFQIKNILSSLEKVQKEQLSTRKEIDYILRTPLKKNEYFIKFDLSKNILFEIMLSNAKRAQELKNYFTKGLRVKDMTLDGKKFIVKCSR
ncbi:hypothetical protein [Nitratiruptor tergarcus]|uniref:Uncharacterized protein n=1 Tax=Nitratiruptor tergarcus DSM 16512 TaxID=1069081 RepID=A0A1W1WVB6_9BACT|nr:hypothetical protein [Nitratiruptor tergarcus]SMC10186.1 hypothetical protein SAMN05660197_2028 [Nitratiruptor tergarcus DSM 16512]